MVTVIYILVLALVLWLILAVAEDAEKRQLVQKREADKKFAEIEEQNREAERLRIASINIEIDILNKKIDQLFDLLKIQFNAEIANKVIEELSKVDLNIAEQIANIVYENSLALIVTHNASEEAKLFVFNIGRWYYSNFCSMLFGVGDFDELIQEDINDIQK